MQDAVNRQVKAVKLLNAANDLFLRGQDRGDFKVTPMLCPNLVKRDNIKGVAHGESQVMLLFVIGQRQNDMSTGELLVNHFD